METLTRMEIPVFTESGLLQAHSFTIAKYACPGCRFYYCQKWLVHLLPGIFLRGVRNNVGLYIYNETSTYCHILRTRPLTFVMQQP